MTRVRAAFQVGPEQIVGLRDRALRDLMERLLLAEAYRSGVNPSSVVVNAEVDAGDEGQDAWTPSAVTPNPWLGDVETCWQFKSGRTVAVKGEIETHRRPQEVIRRGGRYVVIAPAIGNGDTGADTRLMTLREEAARLGLPADQIYLFTCDKIVTWCNEHLSIAMHLAGLPEDWLPLSEWQTSQQHDERRIPFAGSEESRRAIVELQGALDLQTGEARHVHVWGPSGVGKTRRVLEACKTASWRSECIYIRQASGGGAAAIISGLARDVHIRGIIVADEIRGDEIELLNESIQRAEGRLRLISIGHDRPRTDLALRAQEVAPLEELAMIELLRQLYPGMPLDHQRYVAHLADGFVRLAILLGRIVATDAKVTTREVLHHADIRPLLGKLFQSSERASLHVLAALEYVGWEGDVAGEGSVISEHLGLSWASVRTTIQSRANDIVQRRGRYRYLSPRPLALHLAADLWDTHPDQMKTLAGVLPSEASIESFYKRLAALASTGHAREFARSELRFFFRFEHFADPFAVRRWRAISQAAPFDAVRRLGEALTQASHDERRLLHTRARREMIEALVGASGSTSTFDDAVTALAELAEAETETWTNNATGEFVARFAIFGSGCPVPFGRRIQVLDALCARGAAYRRLVVLALSRSASTDRMGVWRDPSLAQPGEGEWEPTAGEAIEAANLALERLEALSRNATEELWPELVKAARECTWLVFIDTTHEAARRLLISVAGGSPLQREQVEAMLAQRFRLERRHHHHRSSPELLERVESALGSLQDSTTRGRLRRLVGRVEFKDRPSAALRDLAVDLSQDPTTLFQEWAFLTSGTTQGAWDLGACLGEADKSGVLLEAMATAGERGPDVRVFCAYLETRAKREPPGWIDEWLDGFEARRPDDAFLLFEATWRCASTDAGASRIVRLLSRASFPLSMETLAYGRWVAGLSTLAFVNVLEALVKHPNQRAAALAVLEHRLDDHPDDFAAVESVALELVCDTDLVRSGQMTEHYWEKTAGRVLSSRPDRIAEAIVRASLLRDEHPWFIEHSSAGGILDRCAEAAPLPVWNALAPLFADRRYGGRLAIGFPSGIVDRVSHDVVLAWVGEDVRYRAALLARVVSKQFADENLAAKLLQQFGDDPVVESTFAGHYQSGSYSGPSSENWRRMARGLDGIAARSSYPRVKSWARGLAEALLQSADRDQRDEEESTLRHR